MTPLKSLGAAGGRSSGLVGSLGSVVQDVLEVKTVHPAWSWEATARIWRRFDESSDRRNGNDRTDGRDIGDGVATDSEKEACRPAGSGLGSRAVVL